MAYWEIGTEAEDALNKIIDGIVVHAIQEAVEVESRIMVTSMTENSFDIEIFSFEKDDGTDEYFSKNFDMIKELELFAEMIDSRETDGKEYVASMLEKIASKIRAR